MNFVMNLNQVTKMRNINFAGRNARPLRPLLSTATFARRTDSDASASGPTGKRESNVERAMREMEENKAKRKSGKPKDDFVEDFEDIPPIRFVGVNDKVRGFGSPSSSSSSPSSSGWEASYGKKDGSGAGKLSAGRGSSSGRGGNSMGGRGAPGRGGRDGGRGGRGGRGGKREGPATATDGKATIRLNKAIAEAGVASRRGADELVFEGRVKVNGNACLDPGTQITPFKDRVTVDGKPIALSTKKFYFAINKPKGFICSNVASEGHESAGRLVVDILQPWVEGWKRRMEERDRETPGPKRERTPPRFFTVGRLDVNSTGLIFVTNDGDWAQSISHPSSGITKEYVVTCERHLGDKDLEVIAAGGVIEDTFVQPVFVQPLFDDTSSRFTRRIKVVVAEGKNREVRRLVGLANVEVKSLKRVRVGGFRLPRDLAIGQFKELKENEVKRVANMGAQKLEEEGPTVPDLP